MKSLSLNYTQHPVFTIGHSNHPPDVFADLLTRHQIQEVVDVRSSPYSRYASQFNKEAIDRLLSELPNGPIDYVYSGQELGGRPGDPTCYHPDGRVNYERLAETDHFDVALRRLVHNADERRIALMCSEKEPLTCHRALLIGRALTERGVDVQHILADGVVEPHPDTMDRLIDLFKLPHHGDMFRSRDDVISDAIGRQARKVAFVGRRASSQPDQWEHTF